ncbi:MAG: hypothetical protein R3D05_02470 [Dongiaceae bacterium]
MNGSSAAREHLDVMEARIAQQAALIVELRASGEDTFEAAQRLALLRSALEEMRVQLAGLLPTEATAGLKPAR